MMDVLQKYACTSSNNEKAAPDNISNTQMYRLSPAFHISFSSYFLFVLAQSYGANTASPIIDLGYVSYRGYQNATAGINYYRGIPYAQPPIGSLRWRKPRVIEASNDFAGQVVDVTKIAPACYQSLPFSLYSPANVSNTSFIATPQGQSEDCLILDILVPSRPISKSIPVLVQLHGGGYTEGSAQSYPGDALVYASSGSLIYVYVTISNKLHKTYTG
jgi:hypothetical protein